MNMSRRTRLFMLLAMLAIASGATLSDQYNARHGTRHIVEATDQPSTKMIASMGIKIPENPFKLATKDEDNKEGLDSVDLGEMQVGCGHGYFDIRPAPKQTEKKLIRKRALEELQRKRRNYQSTFTIWQPPVYQLTRPYVIPIWGSSGRHPIYFPPQPIIPDDPRKSYLPPKGYLPPVRTTTIGYDDDEDDDTTMPLIDRNLGTYDDSPIWDIEPPLQQSPPRTTPAPPNPQATRRTRRPNVRTTQPPPLVHRSENNTNQRPNTLRPVQDSPNVIDVPDDFRPAQTTQRPSAVRPATTQSPQKIQPSRCVWAIISCCTGTTKNISYSCFEQLGCQGAFWDQSPCESEFAKAAIAIALQYYSQK